MPLTPQQQALAADWHSANTSLQTWKAKEKELRDQLVAELSNPSNEKGTEHIQVANGWTLDITKGLDYKLDNPNGQLVVTLTACYPEEIRNNLVRWKPELALREYAKLNAEQKAFLTPFLTIKPSSPQVKLVPPEPEP